MCFQHHDHQQLNYDIGYAITCYLYVILLYIMMLKDEHSVYSFRMSQLQISGKRNFHIIFYIIYLFVFYISNISSLNYCNFVVLVVNYSLSTVFISFVLLQLTFTLIIDVLCVICLDIFNNWRQIPVHTYKKGRVNTWYSFWHGKFCISVAQRPTIRFFSNSNDGCLINPQSQSLWTGIYKSFVGRYKVCLKRHVIFFWWFCDEYKFKKNIYVKY